MQIVTPLGHTLEYTISEDGTAYRGDTPAAVVRVLEEARKTRERLRIHLGDRETGKAWGDIETGYIGRGSGRIKVPLVLCNRNSLGGGALLDNCIVKIEYANKKDGGTLWQAAALGQ